LQIRRFATETDRHLSGSFINKLRREASQSLAEREMRSESFQLLGRDGGNIYRLTNGAFEQEIGHLIRDIDGDLHLRLLGGGAEMRRDDDGVELEQRIIGGGRFLDENIERGTRAFP